MKAVKYLVVIIMLLQVNRLAAQQDSLLNQYLVEAAENNPGLKSYYNDYLAMLEKVPQAGTLPDPTVSFGYFIRPVETRVGPQQATISVMQMMPWFGTLGAREDVFVTLAKAKFEMFQSAKNSLYQEVKIAWYQMHELKQSVQVSNQILEVFKSYESLATVKFENGSTNGMVDVLRIQMEIAKIENAIQLLEDKMSLQKVSFNNLLNKPAADTIIMADTIRLMSFDQMKWDLSDSVSANNNKLASLKLQKESAEQSILLAQKEGYPSLGVGFNYIFIGERQGVTIPDNGKNAFLPMVTVSIPLYRSKYKAKVNEAELTTEGLDYQIVDMQNRLNTQFEMLWVDYVDAGRRVLLFNDQKEKAKQALSILVQAYTADGKDFEELLRMQIMIMNYDLEIIKAIKDRNIAIAKIQALYDKIS